MVSDIMIHGELPAELLANNILRSDLLRWADCITDALTDTEYHVRLAKTGFTDIDLEVTRRYRLADLPQPLPTWLATRDPLKAEVLVSTFVRATKPASTVSHSPNQPQHQENTQ